MPERMKFTTRSIAALKRDPARAEYVVWNADVPAFGIRLRGDTKTYIDQTRVNGRAVKSTIGDVNKITLENATKIAKQHFAEARLGTLGADKARAKGTAEAKLTLGHVADQYLKAHEKALSDNTYAAAARYFERHWGPLRSLPLNRIDRRIVAARLRELIGEHGPSAASKARATLSALYAWAIGEGLCDDNPVLGTNDPAAGITPRRCDRLPAHPGHARVDALHPAGAEQRLVVVGQLHEADAEFMQDLDQAEIVLDRHRRLQAEKYRRTAALLGEIEIVGGAPQQNEIAVIAEARIPVDKIAHRIAEAVVIAQRRVDGRHAGLAHLKKDLARPVAELQPVDQRRRGRVGAAHRAGPAWRSDVFIRVSITPTPSRHAPAMKLRP